MSRLDVSRPDMSRPLRVMLVGYGPVGARFVEELLPAVRGGTVQLTVVGAEDADAYNRVLIAEYAVGRTDRAALTVTDTPAAIDAGVRMLRGSRVTAIDTEAHIVTVTGATLAAAGLPGAERVEYDRLVLATGSRANIPTLDGIERTARDRPSLLRAGADAIAHDPRLPSGITVLRDLADAERVRTVVEAGQRIIVLGAGVLGLELALAAAGQGAQVSVVHHGGYPMPRNLDRGGGMVLSNSLREAGIEVIAHSRAESVLLGSPDAIGDDSNSTNSASTKSDVRRFEALCCADGKVIAGELLLLSCGVSPRTELATLAGLPTAGGILVDTELRSWGDDHVFAIGDCAHVAARPDDGAAEGVHGAPSGLIGPGWRQAEWLAGRLAAEAVGGTPLPALAAERPAIVMLKAEGIDVVSAGVVDAEPWDSEPLASGEGIHAAPRRRVSQWADPEHGRYVKMVTRGGVLEGMVSVGMPRTGAELMLLFERGSELPADRSILLRHDGPDEVSTTVTGELSADETVCWCNAVTVGHIHDAIDEGNTTVTCVGAATRAGTGCGGCKGRIAELIDRFSASGDPVGIGV
jgi:assimilatory nitrate reductase electron transfer subunit